MPLAYPYPRFLLCSAIGGAVWLVDRRRTGRPEPPRVVETATVSGVEES